MACARKVPPEMQWQIVRLSNFLNREQLQVCLGYSKRSIERVVSHFRDHRTVPDEVPAEIGYTSPSPDQYLDELQEMMAMSCGTYVPRPTVLRTLHRAGVTMERIDSDAAEQAEKQHLEFIVRIGQYAANQLVFVDESAEGRQTTYEGHTYSFRGSKAQRKAFLFRGRRFSVLPAVSLVNGVLHTSVVEGSFRAETFLKFIVDLLTYMQPFPAPNSVIVMDTCELHTLPQVGQKIEERGMRCEFLPPRSPSLNPVELAFTEMRRQLHWSGDYMRMATTNMSDKDIYIALVKAFVIIPLNVVNAWYVDCGYV